MLKLEKDTRHKVRFVLNGSPVSGWADARMLLSDFLRQELGETGTHVGCEHGVCGACTVRIEGRAVRSCLTLAVQAEGFDIQTVEGLAGDDGALNALQTAFRKHHALQCGYCTSGILMSLTDMFQRNPSPSRDEIEDVVGGHICRCTGYAGIMDAALEVAEAGAGK
ncbi:MAG: (2Fe-2S)-binding protein [Rhodospirillaceae bacterium]|jgi:2-furoyl-CoA dehydrogenase 2Fe-2S iron sulfur subunit|nr:(2Fe-2S)-binding protein [Rhodospirillaceae bacterium]MBT4116627.1 (2Fe-2S)-binding protein [Rhodospirillaceae bacterium]MBT4672161.1 (2Fe-2S)-binding protein [Rhodospirillaceae bacterium]MBT4719071.1 (2Fe-2S)-binding protein [Rhodospirillaceae bacterium]MBT4749870.1 (2Fe-2S)-binding protein [Rhodospirillaceae bacterium]